MRMCIETNSDGKKKFAIERHRHMCTHVTRSPIGNDWWCVRVRAPNTHAIHLTFIEMSKTVAFAEFATSASAVIATKKKLNHAISIV